MVVHVRIPSHSKVIDANGTTTVYNIYLNGVYHCSSRYSRLAELDSLLRKNINSSPTSSLLAAKTTFLNNAAGANSMSSNVLYVPPNVAASLPSFPPRKFPLIQMSEAELEERRCLLEQYLQFVCSVDEIVSSPLFSRFFISLELDSMAIRGTSERFEIDIDFVNDSSLKVMATADSSPHDVIVRICSEIHLPLELSSFFGLFLQIDGVVVRRLLDCESAYLATNRPGLQNRTAKLLFKRDYYHPKIDELLVHDQTAVNLLFIEAVQEWRQEICQPNEQQKSDLEQMKQSNLRSDFLQTIRAVPYYGAAIFKDCRVTFRKVFTDHCVVRIGNGVVSVSTLQRCSKPTYLFELKRVSCWQVSYVNIDKKLQQQDQRNGHHNGNNGTSSREYDELSFQYRDSSGSCDWVKIYCAQASLMGHCLGRLMEDCLKVRNLLGNGCNNCSSVSQINTNNNPVGSNGNGHVSRSSSISSSASSNYLTNGALDYSTASFAALRNGVNNDGQLVNTSLASALSLSQHNPLHTTASTNGRSYSNGNGHNIWTNGNNGHQQQNRHSVAAADFIGDDDL